MKIRFLLALVGLAIFSALPTIAQEKEEANPFVYRAIPATPQIAQQLEPINLKLDEHSTSTTQPLSQRSLPQTRL